MNSPQSWLFSYVDTLSSFSRSCCLQSRRTLFVDEGRPPRDPVAKMANPYTLYYNDYSICSIMVRYTISLCERLRKDCPIQIEQRVIDIQHGGQLTEFYLCEVNPKGTVHSPDPHCSAPSLLSTNIRSLPNSEWSFRRSLSSPSLVPRRRSPKAWT